MSGRGQHRPLSDLRRGPHPLLTEKPEPVLQLLLEPIHNLTPSLRFAQARMPIPEYTSTAFQPTAASAHVTFSPAPAGPLPGPSQRAPARAAGPVPLPTARPRRQHERWTESQARTLVAVVRDLGIAQMEGEAANRGWESVGRMFGRGVQSCKAAIMERIRADGGEG